MREKDEWLQVRMEGHERDAVDDLAQSYGVDSTSQFVRMAIEHIARTRPTLSIYPILTEEDRLRYEAAWPQKQRQLLAEAQAAGRTTKDKKTKQKRPVELADIKPRAWLQIRVSPEDSAHLKAVARDYGVDISKFVRVVLGYFREVRPKMELLPLGKAFALAA